MKKICIILLLTCISLSLFSCTLNSDSNEDNSKNKTTTEVFSTEEVITQDTLLEEADEEIKPLLKIAKREVKTYYTDMMTENVDFPRFKYKLKENLRKYIEVKFKYDSKYDYHYLKEEYNLLAWKTVENYIWCEVSVKIDYISKKDYEGAGTDIISDKGFGEVIQIVFDVSEKQPVIVDFYNGDLGSFDSSARGEYLDLSNKDNWLSDENIDEILKKGKTTLELVSG